MAQSTFNPVHQLSVLNVRRCGRMMARFLLKSAHLTEYRLAARWINRVTRPVTDGALRRDLSDRYVRRHTPSRLLGWR